MWILEVEYLGMGDQDIESLGVTDQDREVPDQKVATMNMTDLEV